MRKELIRHYTSPFGRNARVWSLIDMGKALPNRFYVRLYLKGKTVEGFEIQFTTLEHVEEKAALWVRDGSRF